MSSISKIAVPLIGFGGVICAAAMLLASPAHADTYDVCEYLDARPSVAGVEDLIAMGMTGNGWTPEYTGKFIADQVFDNCPRHTIELRAFIAKWSPTGRQV